jgi:hypothetical protein
MPVETECDPSWGDIQAYPDAQTTLALKVTREMQVKAATNKAEGTKVTRVTKGTRVTKETKGTKEAGVAQGTRVTKGTRGTKVLWSHLVVVPKTEMRAARG